MVTQISDIQMLLGDPVTGMFKPPPRGHDPQGKNHRSRVASLAPYNPGQCFTVSLHSVSVPRRLILSVGLENWLAGLSTLASLFHTCLELNGHLCSSYTIIHLFLWCGSTHTNFQPNTSHHWNSPRQGIFSPGGASTQNVYSL